MQGGRAGTGVPPRLSSGLDCANEVHLRPVISEAGFQMSPVMGGGFARLLPLSGHPCRRPGNHMEEGAGPACSCLLSLPAHSVNAWSRVYVWAGAKSREGGRE